MSETTKGPRLGKAESGLGHAVAQLTTDPALSGEGYIYPAEVKTLSHDIASTSAAAGSKL